MQDGLAVAGLNLQARFKSHKSSRPVGRVSGLPACHHGAWLRSYLQSVLQTEPLYFRTGTTPLHSLEYSRFKFQSCYFPEGGLK